MAIYKMFNGNHIDLDKIVEITPAVFDDRMGSGGYFVCFSILFQLMDKRTWYEFDGEGYSEKYNPDMRPPGVPLYPAEIEFASGKHKAWCEEHMVKWLQDKVDVVVEEWKKCKTS